MQRQRNNAKHLTDDKAAIYGANPGWQAFFARYVPNEGKVFLDQAHFNHLANGFRVFSKRAHGGELVARKIGL